MKSNEGKRLLRELVEAGRYMNARAVRQGEHSLVCVQLDVLELARVLGKANQYLQGVREERDPERLVEIKVPDMNMGGNWAMRLNRFPHERAVELITRAYGGDEFGYVRLIREVGE